MSERVIQPVEPPDVIIDRIASGQHGVITRRQAVQAGLSDRAIDRRIATGRFHALYRGVYRTGPLIGQHTRAMGAVLACGANAVLSHLSAAAVWGMLANPTTTNAVEVTIPRSCRRRVDGIVAHRSRRIEKEDITTCDGIPLTSPVRTILDLSLAISSDELTRAIAAAERRGLASAEDLSTRAKNGAPHPGAARICRLLALTDVSLTRSEAEVRLLKITRLGRLPRPRVNATLLGYEVDFLWEEQRLVVEVDGFAYHSSERAFARDRRRDAELTTAGFNVVRFTWDDVSRHPEATLVRLAQALQRPQAAVSSGRRS